RDTLFPSPQKSRVTEIDSQNPASNAGYRGTSMSVTEDSETAEPPVGGENEGDSEDAQADPEAAEMESRERAAIQCDGLSPVVTPHYRYIRETAELEAVLPHLLGKTIALDVETTGLDPFADRIRMVQLSDGAHTFVIDGNTAKLLALCPIFSSPGSLFV